MQNTLAKEQQAPIFLNLIKQTKDDSIFIPEKIELHTGLKEAGISAEETLSLHFEKKNKYLTLVRKRCLI